MLVSLDTPSRALGGKRLRVKICHYPNGLGWLRESLPNVWCTQYGGTSANFRASECSSQFQRRSEGPEEASFILSRATEGNRVPPEIQMVYPCEATASAPTKGQIPQFHFFSFLLFPSLQWRQQQSGIQTHACVIMHNTDRCFVSCRGLICGNEGRE